jgi:hypothetical protein
MHQDVVGRAEHCRTTDLGRSRSRARRRNQDFVQAPPWPGASFTEEQPEPGAGIRIALALERAARAGVRVYIARAREAGMSWHEVGGALGVAGLAQARGGGVRVRGRAAGRPQRADRRVPVGVS